VTTPDDSAYARALEFSRSRPPDQIVTTDEVLSEYVTFFSGMGPSVRRQAGDNAVALLRNPRVKDLGAGKSRLPEPRSHSQNRALTAVKSLLSFAHQTGYLPFNVGIAVKLRPNRDALAQRILEESEIARLIEAAPPGRIPAAIASC
jgi:site-specific recombinase XerD